MDDIIKTDVDEDQIAPYMADIMRQFEYVDKEDLIKKMVTVTFGRFLDYYEHAPEIEKPVMGKNARSERDGQKMRGKVSNGRRKHETEAGYKRLFINLGKSDGFYPGEIMQYINKHVHGRQDVGHIDLLQKFAYIEVPEDDARKVMKALNGTTYKGREVRCNDAEEDGHGRSNRSTSRSERVGKVARSEARKGKGNDQKGGRTKAKPQADETDWRSLINGKDFKLKGEEPDFSEEGWARRRPKKK